MGEVLPMKVILCDAESDRVERTICFIYTYASLLGQLAVVWLLTMDFRGLSHFRFTDFQGH